MAVALTALMVYHASMPAAAGPARVLNDFDLSGALIPTDAILQGGPPRDGIPALDRPRSTGAAQAQWPDDELVVGVAVNGEARAYPLSILVWHELINDELGGVKLVVSYCPLCGSALVFDRHVELGPSPAGANLARGPAALDFGVSGLLYKSDLLMFDRQTESLWTQIGGRGVTGSLAGRRLELIRSTLETWKSWRESHSTTTIVSRETGHVRDYEDSPYLGYPSSPQLFFPVPAAPSDFAGSRAERYHPKMWTVGVRLPSGSARAYPTDEISRSASRVSEEFEGHRIVITLDPATNVLRVDAPPVVEVIQIYWFAWMAFHPNSTVYQAEDELPTPRDLSKQSVVPSGVREPRIR